MKHLFFFCRYFCYFCDARTHMCVSLIRMRSLRIYPSSINEKMVDEAVEALRGGELILYPTDTLYAIACSALNQGAIEKICRIKGINPQKESLSIVCSDISQASEYARIDNKAFRIFKGRRTVGVRVPGNPIATALARELGNPLLTTSVSYDEERSVESVSSPEVVALAYADRVSLIIDGGDVPGEPSTVVDITDSSLPEIVRQGAGMLID